MHSVLIRPEPGAEEALSLELWQHGTLGVIEEPDGWRAFFDETSTVPAILQISAGSILAARDEPEPSPSAFTKHDWDPILVGNCFWIAPSWIHQPTPPGRLRLAIDTPSAFGTGRHETTQLALEALEQHVAPGDTVLDIGSGSGILSQAALMLGAARVFSCDIHLDALTGSRPQLQSPLFLGSADAIRSQTGDIVLANISAKVIDALAWELKRITKPNCVLVVTGFIRDNPPLHFAPEKILEGGDWLCWLCRPEGINASPKPYVQPLQWW